MDEFIVNALRLPTCYLITPEPGDNTGRFLHNLHNALEQGVRLVRLRAWSLDSASYRLLAIQVLELCRNYQASLLLSGDTVDVVTDSITAIGAGGLHVSSTQLMDLSQRPVAGELWMAASSHDLCEVERARSLGVDFITLSPLFQTSSHPQARPLGWFQFQALVDHASMPVYALGGMSDTHIEQVWQHGGQGIAAISSLWDQ